MHSCLPGDLGGGSSKKLVTKQNHPLPNALEAGDNHSKGSSSALARASVERCHGGSDIAFASSALYACLKDAIKYKGFEDMLPSFDSKKYDAHYVTCR